MIAIRGVAVFFLKKFIFFSAKNEFWCSYYIREEMMI